MVVATIRVLHGYAGVVYCVTKLLRFECAVGRGMNCLLVVVGVLGL